MDYHVSLSLKYNYYPLFAFNYCCCNICSKSEENIGLEIDLDSIANMPSSASSPSGWNLDEIRMLVRSFNPNQTAYLNLTEGAVYDAKDRRTLGKALNYLCLDFIRVRE